MKRTAWTLVAFLSLVGKVAYAQGYDDQKQGQPGDQAPGGVDQQAQPPSQPGQAQPNEPAEQRHEPTQAPSDLGTQPDVGTPPAATPSPYEQQGKQGMQGEEKGKEPSARLSQLKADGVKLSALDENQVMELQRSLQTAGYYKAEIDGKAGAKTKQALSSFYRDQAQLASGGVILPQGAAAVGLDQSEIERVRGVEPQQEQQNQQPQQNLNEPQQQNQQPQEQQQNKPMNREGDSTHAPPSTGAPMQQQPGDTMEHPSEGHGQPDTTPMP
jgi:hypothetical protein